MLECIDTTQGSSFLSFTASSHDPGNRDGSVSGRVLSSVHMENFSPVTGIKSGDAIIHA